MKAITLNVLVLAVSAGLAQMAMAEEVTDQSDAKGFVAGSSLTGLLRNYYFNRERRGAPSPGTNNDPIDWTQALIGNFSSGFTQGTVGFGLDVLGQAGVRLDGDTKHSGTGNMPFDGSSKEPNDAFGTLGGDVKVRISKTELKYGDLQPQAPVFAAGGSRLFTASATGFELLSSDIKNLSIDVGHFTASNGPTTTNNDHGIFATYANVQTNEADYAGGKYTFSPSLTASFYAARFQDIWDQYYFDGNYTLPITDTQSVNFDLSVYRTNDTGSAKAGSISNTSYSLAAAYSFLSAHTLTLSYQGVSSDEPFDYVGFGDNGAGAGGDSIFLANSIQWSDFNGPHEKSIGLRYDLDLATYGVPGLSFMARFMDGWGIDGTHTPDNSAYTGFYGHNDTEREIDLQAKYVIQSGPAKDLSLKVNQAYHSGDASTGDHVNELRLIVDYPFTLL